MYIHIYFGLQNAKILGFWDYGRWQANTAMENIVVDDFRSYKPPFVGDCQSPRLITGKYIE